MAISIVSIIYFSTMSYPHIFAFVLDLNVSHMCVCVFLVFSGVEMHAIIGGVGEQFYIIPVVFFAYNNETRWNVYIPTLIRATYSVSVLSIVKMTVWDIDIYL